MRKWLLILPLLLLGCADAPPAHPAGASAQHAECLVCKYNADLACIDVAVDKDTPRYEYKGKTYYFCSEDCREKFAKAPEKYLK